MCPLTPTTPTEKTLTAGLITRFLSGGTKESSRRLIAFISACVLCGAVVALVEAISYQAHRHWAIDGLLVTAFTASVGFVAALAREIFRTRTDPPSEEPKP